MKKLELSIIIPAYNEERDIVECLYSLEKQNYKNFEIIVVDDGSTDNTLKIVKKFKKIRILKQDHQGSGKARNLGAKKAKGKILIFVDADMTFDRNYLKNLIKPLLSNKNLVGTTHELELVKNTKNIWSKCWGEIIVSKEKAKEVTIFRAIRRNKFLKMGGFDPKYGYADDETFRYKYNVTPIVAKGTICYHKRPETLKGVYKQSAWIGASINNFWFNIPIIKYLLPLVLIIIFPLVIPLLSLKKCYKIKNFRILFPWMLIFMTARYFGTIVGIFRKNVLKKNFR